jgi:hypothetical protein
MVFLNALFIKFFLHEINDFFQLTNITLILFTFSIELTPNIAKN